MQNAIINQIEKTILGPSELAPQKPVHGTSLGPTEYISNTSSKPTVFGPDMLPTYTEESFNAAVGRKI